MAAARVPRVRDQLTSSLRKDLGGHDTVVVAGETTARLGGGCRGEAVGAADHRWRKAWARVRTRKTPRARSSVFRGGPGRGAGVGDGWRGRRRYADATKLSRGRMLPESATSRVLMRSFKLVPC